MPNKLYTWGAAANGRLGNGTTTPDVLVPVQIGTATDWDKIAVGHNLLNSEHVLAIKNNQGLAWGSDGSGQCGYGDGNSKLTPGTFDANTTWTTIAAGANHSLGIKNGELWAWGRNSDYQLGDGTTTTRVTPVKIGSDSDWQSLAAGLNFSIAIKGGKLYGVGLNSNGQIGQGNTTSPVTSWTQIGTDSNWSFVAVGRRQVLAIKTNGTLWGWGNRPGLGSGSNFGDYTTPTQIGSSSSWTFVSVGEDYSLGINNGELYATGSNTNGKLGDGTTTSRTTFVKIGSATNWTAVSAGGDHSLGIAGGNLFSWGSPVNGRLGNNSTSGNVLSPTQVGSDNNWFAVEASTAHSVALQNANILPANTVAPSVSGTAKVGQTLTTTDGTWTGTPTPTYTRQWQVSDNGTSGWSNISGATSSTYTILTAQAGKYIRSKITATNDAGAVDAFSSATAQIVEDPAVSIPTISGTSKVGQTLTASASATAGYPIPSISYQWQKSSTVDGIYSNISGATSSTYNLTASEAGKFIRVTATATNSEGSEGEVSLPTAQVVQDPTNTIAPAITGTAKVGQILTTNNGTWQGFPTLSYDYQWQLSNNGTSNWTNISGATNSTYTITASESGKYIRSKVTATNTEAAVDAFSAATNQIVQDPTNTVAPESFGYPLLGETFTTNNGTWQSFPTATYTYQWQVSDNGTSNWTNISGATNSTYVATENEVAKFIRSKVTATNTENSADAFSNSNGPIHQIPEVSEITITGLPAKVGDELSASLTVTAGYPEPSLDYKWLREREDGGFDEIATTQDYTPVSADAGWILKSVITATNVEGEDFSQEETEATLWAPANTHLPTINHTGLLEVGETLIADPGTWTGYPDPATISFTYQWQVSEDGENNWQDVAGATSDQLYLGEEFGQKYARVKVTSTTTAGTADAYSVETGYISEDPEIIVSPTLSGIASYQEDIVVDPGEWGGFPEAEFTYSWEVSANGSSGWQDITGETTDTLTLGEETVGKYVRCYVTGTNPVGSASVHSDVFGPVTRASYLIENPEITGNANLLSILSTDNGQFGGYEEPTFEYAWQLSTDQVTWQTIDGANQATYEIPNDEDLIGQYIRSEVTATNSVGSDTGYSNSLGPIDYQLIIPSFLQGPNILTPFDVPSVNWECEVSFTVDGYPEPNVEIQWQRFNNSIWEDIVGATNTIYIPSEDDLGKQLKVNITLTNTAGSVSSYALSFNVVPEYREPTVEDNMLLTENAYIGKTITITNPVLDGFPLPNDIDYQNSRFEYSFNLDSETIKSLLPFGADISNGYWQVNEDLAQGFIRAKYIYTSPIWDDLIVYSNWTNAVIEEPYQKQTFLPMANAKLNQIYSNTETTGIPHDSEFLPDYTNNRIKWTGEADAFVKSKMISAVRGGTGVDTGLTDRYRETVIIIPKLTIIDYDDVLDINYNDKNYQWKVVDIIEAPMDFGMPDIYKLYVEKA